MKIDFYGCYHPLGNGIINLPGDKTNIPQLIGQRMIRYDR